MSEVKEYEIVKSGTLLKVKWAGGGQLPAVLEGDWTNYDTLKQAIERYEKIKRTSRKATRGVKNGTTEQDSD